MTRLSLAFLLASLLVQPASAAHTGYAARYRKGLMERAAEIHGVTIPAGWSACASPTRSLGERVIVTSRVQGRTGRALRCVVADVAHSRDRAAIVRRGIVIELTPEGALHLCGSVVDPPSQCKVTVEVMP